MGCRFAFWWDVFFKHNMGIGASKPKGTHACSAWQRCAILSGYGFPWGEFVYHIKWSSLQVDIGIEFFEMDTRRNLFMFDRQQYLEQARDACRGFQMADVRLD